MSVPSKPPGYSTATPYLTVAGASAAIEFYKSAFGATEMMRLANQSGQIMHAEMKFGDAPIMISDEFPEWGVFGPRSEAGAGSALMLYVENVDDVFSRAVAAGAKPIMPPEDHFYGDRMGKLIDPFGHVWMVSTHIEDVSPEEMKSRFSQWEAG
jgi:PhnB protein